MLERNRIRNKLQVKTTFISYLSGRYNFGQKSDVNSYAPG